MFRRGSKGSSSGAGAPTEPAGQAAHAPPPAEPTEAAAAAAAAPNPVPNVRTNKGALESGTSWLPGPLQPVGMLAVGFAKAAWAAAVPLARVGYRLAVWSSPVLIWAFFKWANWYFLGWLTKASKVLAWGKWLLSFFSKAAPAA